LASACQHDSDVTFDDNGLTSPDTAGSSSGAGSATGGAEASGGSAAGGTKAGSGNTAGKASSAGMGGETADGGKAGSSDGGSNPSGGAGVAGTTQGGTGGKNASGGSGGSGGTANPDPEPVTVDITDVADTYVSSCYPNANFGDELTVNVDHDQCTYQGLIKPSLAEIPDAAVVDKATLTLTCTNAGGMINVSYVVGNWTELSVDWNNKPTNGTALGKLDCQEVGPVTIDLTVAVKAWLSGAHDDDGVYLRTENSDGTDFASTQAADEGKWPTLSVTYTLPVK
jgi:hypothetical protein